MFISNFRKEIEAETKILSGTALKKQEMFIMNLVIQIRV